MTTETQPSPESLDAASKAGPLPRSAVEGIKEASRQLRGGIGEELAKDSDHFSDQDKQLLKFHGSYQQEDRDARKSRRKEGLGKHYLMMIRCRIPGGKLTAAQYLVLDDLASKYANGTLRITTRQSFQFHGVLKENLKATITGINACLLTTLGACGDVNRNVMACPAPHHHDSVHTQLQETAQLLAVHLAPRTKAYHEIWLNGQPVGDDANATTDVEPIYGKVYLPRKFKIGLALPEDNCVDVYSQDLGFLAIVEKGTVVGYNVLVGGGMGMTAGNPNTFPHLGKPICYVPAQAVLGVAEAVVKLFRDHGNRANRKRARIKYLVHDWGVEKFREVLSGYLGGALHPPRPIEVSEYDLHLGWHPQGDGKWYFGLSVENGRIKDEGKFRLRCALRALIERLQPDIRLTPGQDILLCDLDSQALGEIERILAEHGVTLPDHLSNVQKHSMACPAIPTCGLAISESERALPSVIDELEGELKRLGLEQERLSVRMTGCPNGCARPYQSDIGLVGRSGDKYTVYVGGHVFGHRLNFVLKDLVPLRKIVPLLAPLLEHFRAVRQSGESFGDYCHRLGAEKLQALLLASPDSDGANGKPEASTPGGSPVASAPGSPKNGAAVAVRETRVAVVVGNGHQTPRTVASEGAALFEPQTQRISLSVAEPQVKVRLLETAPTKESETFLAGRQGEELPDYTLRYNNDGSVRETVVYYYGSDLRAAAATAGDPLRREAVYVGEVETLRLHSARKRSDTYYLGAPGHERRDLRLEYHADGTVARTVIFLYDDLRAAEAPSGAPIRRQVAYEGRAD